VHMSFNGLVADPFGPIHLEQVGVAHEKHLLFNFLPTTDQPVLEMRSAVSDINFEIDVPPRIEVRPVRETITGFGLDQVEIRVVRLEPHGAPDPVHENLIANIQVRGPGRPEPSSVVFRPGESQSSFMLRSGGLDDITVSVAAGAHSDSRTLEQLFPTWPLIAVLIGGAIGGFSRRFVKSAPRVKSGMRIVEGLMVAVVAFVAGVLGVGYLNLPAGVVATEGGAFLTGALTGFAGVSAYESLQKRLGRA